MLYTLKTIIKTSHITSIPFSSDKDAGVASDHMLENWGVGIESRLSDGSLVVNMRHNTHKNVFTSETFTTEEAVLSAQSVMLKDWGIQTEMSCENEEETEDFLNFDY
jgi:hypothetical protein